MVRIFRNVWKCLELCFQYVLAIWRMFGGTNDTRRSMTPDRLEQLCDAVYLLQRPEDPPDIEIVFIHGLQFNDSKEAYWKTWLDRGSENDCWPVSWLKSRLPKARVLSLSYDADAVVTPATGRMDLYVLGESLLPQLCMVGVGQNNCPLVFVCHGLGGLVAKQIAIFAHRSQNTDKPSRLLLQNLEGYFFYGTPNAGSRLADYASYCYKGPLLRYLTMLNDNIGRLNDQFEGVQESLGTKWKFSVIAETHETPMGLICQGTGSMKIVEESSARIVGSPCLHVGANHFDICKPVSPTDSCFQALVKFLLVILKSHEVEPLHMGAVQVRTFRNENNLQKKMTQSEVVGVVGMGGIGKTTLCKGVYNLQRDLYDKCCFLEDIKSKSVEDVQRELYGGLCGKDLGRDQLVKSEHLSEIRRCILSRKVLVVYDDIWSEIVKCDKLQIEAFTEGGSGSRAILASRNWQLLKRYTTVRVDMRLLDDDQALELFRFHAFMKPQKRAREGSSSSNKSLENCNGELEEVAMEIVKACGGLPLSLEVMGSCLGGTLEDGDLSHAECLEYWKGALKKLQNAEAWEVENERLWESLRISYDGLCHRGKEMFLDVACFFCGSLRYSMDTLLHSWGGECGDLNVLVKLKERCLIKIEKNGIVTMHDQLRDMGRSVVRDQRGGGVKHMSRIWDYEDMSKFLCIKKPTTTQGLSLGEWGRTLKSIMKWESYETLRDGLILNSPDLRLLDLHEVDMDIIDKIVIKDSSHVQWLCLSTTNVTRIPNFVQTCRRLCVLDLSNSLHLTEISEFIGNLDSLLELDLGGCCALACIPESIGKLVKLLILVVRNCRRLTSIPDSIGNLDNLLELDLGGCSALACIPESIGKLVKLSKLDVWNCKRLTSIPDSIGNLDNLLELDLGGCYALACIPESIGKLVKLSKLYLWNCESLTSIPNSIGNLDNLLELNLGGCSALACIPESIGKLVKLSKLFVRNCRRLTSIPDSIGNLDNLSELDLGGCSALACIPESIVKLVRLSKLSLWSCESLTSIPNSIGNLDNLLELNLAGCIALACIPESIGMLVKLSELYLWSCQSLTSIPDSIGNLDNLLGLNFGGCSALTCIPESIGKLVKLSKLVVRNCRRLTSIPDSIGNLDNLLELNVGGCCALTCIPESIGNLDNLLELDLGGCCALACIPESIGKLVKLSKLYVWGCESLTSIPDSIGNLDNLLELDFTGCSALKSIPELIGKLVKS